ncbi:hypothetical protein BT93_D0605 [Corymbia citriodora subsp. variegata]|nr:hypothetical protein BT93_D0605 [Corymbia citriodora subsp. variegata]
MGNCCAHESASTVWAGDDWESLLATGAEEGEREALLQGDAAGTPYGFASSHGRREQVKIKITKKELRVLLKKVDMQELSPQDVVESLSTNASAAAAAAACCGGHCSTKKHHGPWRPALKSIPEVN